MSRSVDDATAFEAVRQVVLRGEYRDELPTTIEPRIDLPPALANHVRGLVDRQRASRGLEPIGTAELPWRVTVERGSAQHLEAKAAGQMAPLPDLQRASAGAVADAEAGFGYELPPLLKRLYLEIGDGGFGPAGALFPVERPEGGDPLGAPNRLKQGLWPVCDWGCGIVSLVDCRTGDWRMWGFDPNPGQVDEALFEDEFTFAGWIHRWATGRLFQPTLIEDPATGRWRGATQAEMSAWFPND
jgi:hypothetical protein